MDSGGAPREGDQEDDRCDPLQRIERKHKGNGILLRSGIVKYFQNLFDSTICGQIVATDRDTDRVSLERGSELPHRIWPCCTDWRIL